MTPEQAHYRPGDQTQNCANCKHFMNGQSEVLDMPVEPQMCCDYWESAQPAPTPVDQLYRDGEDVSG